MMLLSPIATSIPKIDGRPPHLKINLATMSNTKSAIDQRSLHHVPGRPKECRSLQALPQIFKQHVEVGLLLQLHGGLHPARTSMLLRSDLGNADTHVAARTAMATRFEKNFMVIGCFDTEILL
jgi:hypothetical protein